MMHFDELNISLKKMKNKIVNEVYIFRKNQNVFLN